MGASTFRVSAKGASAEEAFNAAVAEARAEFGSSAYSGTIATKSGFRLFPLPHLPKGVTPSHLVSVCLEGLDEDPDEPMWAEPARYAFDASLQRTVMRPGVSLPERLRPEVERIAEQVGDKWDAAGCFDLGNGNFLFFGWAAE